MRFRFAPTFLALVLALAAGLALAGDSFPGFLPFSRGGGGGGGGLTPGAADAAYLRLDATNDPVTGEVEFGTSGGNETFIDHALVWSQVLDTEPATFASVSTANWTGAAFTTSATLASFPASYTGNGYCTSAADSPGSSELWLGGAATGDSRICGDVTTGVELGVSTSDGTTFENNLALTGTGPVINDNGAADLDFRVEGDTNANLLYCDAGSDSCAFGTSTNIDGTNRLTASVNDSTTNIDAVNAAFASRNENTTNNSFAMIGLQSLTTAGATWGVGRILARAVNHTAASINGDLIFQARQGSGSAWSEPLAIIGSNSRVGVGTLTPAVRLDVQGQISTDAATAAAPGYTFEGDTNTGMYRSGADRIAFSTGGTDRAEITVSNLFSYVPIGVEAGAAGAPTLTFTNDQNTGFYSPAADTCALATGGVERFTVSATAATSTLPIRAPSGTATAVGVGHSTMVDSGLAWDTGIDAMYLLNNTGSIAIDANGGGALSLDADATSYITIGGVGQDLIIDPSGDVEIAANLYPQASMIGTATTGTGPGGVGLWRHPRIVNDAPSKPTCDATWEGSTLYVDDSNDALAGMLCYCSADSGRATWGWLTTVGTTCP